MVTAPGTAERVPASACAASASRPAHAASAAQQAQQVAALRVHGARRDLAGARVVESGGSNADGHGGPPMAGRLASLPQDARPCTAQGLMGLQKR
jgi:hypothetical protein